MNALGWNQNKRIGIYGDKGPFVIVLHGGPGAPGSAAPLARGLAADFRVFEPWQRGSSDTPLSVAVHISDLHQLIRDRCGKVPPALIGESWGAMLALAYAARHPEHIGPIVLVGCGTFAQNARDELIRIRRQRIFDYIRKHPEHRSDLKLSMEDQVMKWHHMTDSYHPETGSSADLAAEPFDLKAHTETWADMMRCQNEGRYPRSFTAIRSAVLMLHGAYDPHPGPMISDHLKQYIPHLEYQELAKCGHSPATEKFAKHDFFRILRNWLNRKHPFFA